MALLDDIDEILIPEEVLQTRIRELGRTISTDYNGKEPLLVAILTGAVLFVSDLIRQVSIACQLDFMATSSYGVKTESSGIVRILKDLDQSIEGRHVIIVDDIIDTGLTMDYLLETLKARYPASLKVCALLVLAVMSKATPFHAIWQISCFNVLNRMIGWCSRCSALPSSP